MLHITAVALIVLFILGVLCAVIVGYDDSEDD